MSTVAGSEWVEQAAGPTERERLQPSASGGVLVLARAWQALGGADLGAAGIRWRGVGSGLLLFALVALPILWARSVRAVATTCARGSDPFWAVVGWAGVVTQQRGLACQFADFERRSRHGTVLHRWYLVTSHRTWDAAAIWQHWQWRWPVEELHRDGKQHLRLADFHVRTAAGLTAWLTCTSLRAGLLAFLQATTPARQSLSTEALVMTPRTTACLVEDPPDEQPARLHWPHSCPGSPDPAFTDYFSPEDLHACLAA